MSRASRERLADAVLHLDAATTYAAEGPLDEKTIDAICSRTRAALDPSG